MRPHWVFLLLLLLSGCDKSPSAPPTVKSEIGRFMVAPIGGKDIEGAIELWSAWRLDTKTGDLEFCTYSITNNGPNKPPYEMNACSKPALGPDLK